MACGGEWEFKPNTVIRLIGQYNASPAQFRVDDKPFVSTFEGPGWPHWEEVRSILEPSTMTGGIFLVPDWSSIGPHGLADKMDLIDGACELWALEPSGG